MVFYRRKCFLVRRYTKVCWARSAGCCRSWQRLLRCFRSRIRPALFMMYFLMASRDSFIKKGEGGAQPNISRVKLVEHLIPLPPLNEQKRIVKRIETLFEQLH